MKDSVAAIINANTGWITIRRAPGTQLDPILSYPDKSFVSVMIGNRIFTNNTVGDNIGTDPRFGGLLQNGYTQRIGDTIRTTWANKDGCDIIQEVYIVKLDASEQAVMRWKVKNNSTGTPVWGQAQFLLDIQVGKQNPDDGAAILTRYGYRPIWEQYDMTGQYGIPWFFAAFENKLPNTPYYDPGITGVGYTHDVNYKLGLKRPVRLTVGDWQYPRGLSLVDNLWGVVSGVPWGNDYTDAAILYEWDGVGIAPGKTTEIARTSYGTGEFAVCYGQLFGIVFYPRRFTWNTTKYLPDPANIEFYAFNVYSPINGDKYFGPPSYNTHIKLHTGPNLRIVSPSGNAKVQLQRTQPDNGLISQREVGTAFWTIQADKALNCQGQLLSWLKFTGESSLLGTGSIFINSGDADTCEHPVRIDCVEEDFEAPIVDNLKQLDSCPYVKTFDVRDDRVKDKGVKEILWTAQPGSGTDVSKFSIEVPSLPNCPKPRQTIKITQLDTKAKGCFDFTFIDCAGNDTAYSICILDCPVKPPIDSLDPLITTVERTPGYAGAAPCNGRCDSLLFTDNRISDLGLESIAILSQNNMRFDALTVKRGAPLHRGKVCVVDTMQDGSITIRVRDIAGNFTDSTYTYCTIRDTIPPVITIAKQGSGRGHWLVTVTELNLWDRLINSIVVTTATNVTINPPVATGKDLITFDVDIVDSTKNASFCIKADDLAGNTSNESCGNVYADPDGLCPNIVRTPPAGTNVTSITVEVNDYHTNAQGDTLGWDKGVDSIWFSEVRGVVVPPPMKIGCKMTAPPFTLSVEDTLNVDIEACVKIHAVDCAGNECVLDWCYPYKPDDLPPYLRVYYTSRTQLKYEVADSLLYDRGLNEVTLKNEVNFAPVKLNLSREPSLRAQDIIRPNYSTSSVGTLEAIDHWGAVSASSVVKAAHSASVEVGVWVQDLEMKRGEIVRESGSFELPIRFLKNDTFELERKGIDEFEFTFTLSGDVQAVNFLGARTQANGEHLATAADGWLISWSNIGGNTYRVYGKKLGARSLFEVNGDTLLALTFDALKNEFTKDIVLSIDQVGGETITYNSGNSDTVIGKSAIAILPAPYGTLTGSHIVVVGVCSPSIETGGQPPSVVTLEQNTPNPFAGKTTFTFTTKEDGMVKLAIYDMLGNEIESVVNTIMGRGRYKVQFDGSKYGSGAYIARLQANGTVRSRTMHIDR